MLRRGGLAYRQGDVYKRHAHILELAVALAVAVEIEPGAADALRCQSAGQMRVHGLVAAAAAGIAVQVHHKGYLALGVGQGHRCV